MLEKPSFFWPSKYFSLWKECHFPESYFSFWESEKKKFSPLVLFSPLRQRRKLILGVPFLTAICEDCFFSGRVPIMAPSRTQRYKKSLLLKVFFFPNCHWIATAFFPKWVKLSPEKIRSLELNINRERAWKSFPKDHAGKKKRFQPFFFMENEEDLLSFYNLLSSLLARPSCRKKKLNTQWGKMTGGITITLNEISRL